MCASIPAGSQAATRGKQVLVGGTRSGLCRTPAPVPDGSVVGGLVLVHSMWPTLTASQGLQRSQTKGLASARTCSRCSPFGSPDVISIRSIDSSFVRLTAALPAHKPAAYSRLGAKFNPGTDKQRPAKGHSAGGQRT